MHYHAERGNDQLLNQISALNQQIETVNSEMANQQQQADTTQQQIDQLINEVADHLAQAEANELEVQQAEQLKTVKDTHTSNSFHPLSY